MQNCYMESINGTEFLLKWAFNVGLAHFRLKPHPFAKDFAITANAYRVPK